MLDKNLNQEREKMSIWKAMEVIDNYRNNGREITSNVIQAYKSCSQLGRTSYLLMESIVGGKIAQEVVQLDKTLYLKNKKTLDKNVRL